MATPWVRAGKRSRTPYWLRFSLALLSLGGITSAFVLVVLPRRFVLQAGLVESGITFPAHAPPFRPPRSGPVVRPALGEAREEITLGPAEVFWDQAVPLLEAGMYDAALPLFEEYLGEYPTDLDVWREYAATLARAGRPLEAEAAYTRLLAAADDPAIRRELARLKRDGGDFAAALALYEQLATSYPEDLELQLELARTLVWAQRYREAQRVYRTLLRHNPDDYSLRLELAQAVYWDGDPLVAFLVLADLPAGARESPEGKELRLHLDSLRLEAMPPGLTPLDQARRAVAEQDLALALRLYRRVLATHSTEAAVWLEWTDFLQYYIEDLAAARDALERLQTLRPLEPAERFRLAQLHAWTGNELQARRVLEGLLRDQPQRVEAWVLLGDLHQWNGSRLAARDAYRRALTYSPDNPQALAGLDSLNAQTYRAIAATEDRSVGTRLLFFRDSDDFGRLDMTAEAAFLRRATVLVVQAGYRRLEGIELQGRPDRDHGPFAALELAHWWRLGTVRASLAAGIEQLDAFGTQPSLEARLYIPNSSGTAISALYHHGPAYSQTVTFESIQATLLSDYVEAAAYRQMGSAWSLSVNGGVGSLRTSDDANLRTSLGAAAVYDLSSVVAVGLTTQYLTLADSAPRGEGRKLYWDPKAFWATGVRFELSAVPRSRWNLHVRLTPGVALSNERDGPGPRWVPQLTSEAGILVDTRRFLVTGDLAYLRGREGDYNSFGANLRFAVKY
ncbi:MAG: tetratricopeptide repeat protein [Gemmatimonadota bacterium]|nr:MAG: tetratricopeptide repeat protein [Gemmatimonadota bacterium]